MENTNTINPNRFFTRTQLAALLGISRRTLYSYMQQQKIKVAARRMVAPKDAAKIIEAIGV